MLASTRNKVFNRETGSYLFFGIVTTAINYLVYLLCRLVFGLEQVMLNTSVSWLVSIIFAYWTNKVWVFQNRNFDVYNVTREFLYFIASRLLSGILDITLMMIFVYFLEFNDVVMKVISSFVIIVLNYDLSKRVVFRKKQNLR